MQVDNDALRGQIEEKAVELGRLSENRGVVCTTVESCTAGGLSYAITAVAGSSSWFDRGFVTYTNEAKEELVGVSHATLAAHGAVSEETAREMAAGALRHAQKAWISASITGIAGPGGAVPGKPVGTVCFGFARRADDGMITVESVTEHFEGNRETVRLRSILRALTGLCALACR